MSVLDNLSQVSDTSNPVGIQVTFIFLPAYILLKGIQRTMLCSAVVVVDSQNRTKDQHIKTTGNLFQMKVG